MPISQPQPIQNAANSLIQQQPQQFQIGNNIITKGSLVIFPYLFYKHDAMPCVIISSVVPGYILKGVNLHYLTFPYVKKLLSNQLGFNYYSIKADQYLVDAFRSYLWKGIRFDNIKIIDGAFLLKMMTIARSFDPLQIKAIRQEIERQVNQGFPQQQASSMVTQQ